jgi:hypothetical protein
MTETWLTHQTEGQRWTGKERCFYLRTVASTCQLLAANAQQGHLHEGKSGERTHRTEDLES